MKGVGLMHLTRVNLGSIKKFFAYLQEGVPGKLRAIHILNVVYFFDKILSMIKPFMRAEILKCVRLKLSRLYHNNWIVIFVSLLQLYLHSSSMDYEKFYADHIPKSCLPSDFGGNWLYKKICNISVLLLFGFYKIFIKQTRSKFRFLKLKSPTH